MSSVNRPEHVPGARIRDLAELLEFGEPHSGNPRDGVELITSGANDSAAQVKGVTLDSRQVQSGDLYAALRGANTHGASFTRGAIESGAVAVLTDEEGRGVIERDGARAVPLLVVPDPRAVLGHVSAAVYGNPARALEMVGVTGTNGKTTVSYLVESAWRALGRTTGLIGTIETRIGARSVRSVHTTPEAPALQGLLAVMAEHEVSHCVMEVSSHALALHRVDAVQFGTAVFTNLSQDHLDFHGTMESYFEAKALLFTPQRARRAVVCVDDAWGERLARRAEIPTTTLVTPVRDTQLDPAAGSVRPDWRLVPDGDEGRFRLVREGAIDGPDEMVLESALPGDHNRINTALAALVLLDEGIPSAEVARALARHPRVPGRMERVELTRDNAKLSTSGPPSPSSAGSEMIDAGEGVPEAIVDFAHTPDALSATLGSLRPMANRRGGRLVAVLGAGGDRDSGKREQMGAAAARWADVVVVTDDNPRREDPAAIRAVVAAGARSEAENHPERHVVVHEVDGRARGIFVGLNEAGADGVLAVLGKGHETTQVIGATATPFDDREAIAAAWARRSTDTSGATSGQGATGEHHSDEQGAGR